MRLFSYLKMPGKSRWKADFKIQADNKTEGTCPDFQEYL
jgi:hypothetical protein